MADTPQTSRPLSLPIAWIGRAHQALVFQRRARVLSEMLVAQIPQGAAVLDIGCGDGTIGNLIAGLRPDVTVRGVEFLVRPECKIECHAFDGTTLPFADTSFDVCLFVDVLHHTEDPSVMLREAVRVSRAWVLLKDHLDENLFDNVTLRIMDWVGNRPHGVVLPYNYQGRRQWEQHFANCGLTIVQWEAKVPLYSLPISLLAGRGLHFISLLKKT
jgi:SAM-dependent methyltransferase